MLQNVIVAIRHVSLSSMTISKEHQTASLYEQYF